ncbi:hypothetical protein LPJ62_000511 [Coemansia sp. RSA 2167]|nr:hypothetical protein LPJ62_000511 [Coemansia sp. RSA 2167]KAJ2421469.1 hypothetical protein GGF47_003957 [Coemansia sp. RSA 2524]
MAPGRPSPVNRISNGNGRAANGHSNGRATNGNHPRRRRLDQRQSAEIYGLPEYLYNAYSRLSYMGAYGRELSLLVDADTGDEITFRQFQSDASTLARNLETWHGVAPHDTVAILSISNIDIPIVSVAAWTARASIVVLPPDLPVNELRAMLVQRLPRVMFVSQALVERAQQVLAGIASGEGVRIITIDSEDGGDTGVWNIRDLYTRGSNQSTPGERQMLSFDEAQELTAVVYFNHQPADGEEVTVTTNDMSHYGVISYCTSSLRRSPSLPDTRASARQPTSTSSRPQTPVSQRVPIHTEPTAALDYTPSIAFTVLRMHRAYRLHRVLFDMFCRGARYIVAHVFDPPQFIIVVSQYELTCAELTFAEIKLVVDYLHSFAAPRSSSDLTDSASYDAPSLGSELMDMLSTLRFIYTESDRAELELGPDLAQLLPNASIIRTRFGTYIEPPVRPRT